MLAVASTLTLSPAGSALIRFFESCGRRLPDGRMQAYPDPRTGAKPWTIGWGSTGPDIAKGVIWPQAQCDARFARDTAMMAAGVSHLLGGAPTTQHQFDALVSFAYNVGLDDDLDAKAEGLGDSTLLSHHRAGQFGSITIDPVTHKATGTGAAGEFLKWDHAGGVVMAGLTRRRTAEAELYATPDNSPAPRLA